MNAGYGMSTQALAMAVYRQGKATKGNRNLQILQTMFPKNEYFKELEYGLMWLSAISTPSKTSQKSAEAYQKAVGTYAKITADKLIPDKPVGRWPAENIEFHLNGYHQSGLLLEATNRLSQTQTVRYAQSALMRFARPPMARDTTRKTIPGPAVNTTKKK